MPTANAVRQYIHNLASTGASGALFTSRDLLHLGTRTAVDQAVSMCIKEGRIKRVARGVFATYLTPTFTALQVAQAKARAFGKQILSGADSVFQEFAARGIKLDIAQRSAPGVISFPTNGCSSQFRFGDLTIRFRSVCARHFQLGDSLMGKMVRMLWQLGRRRCDREAISQARTWMRRPDVEQLRRPLTAHLIPGWLFAFVHPPWIGPRKPVRPLPVDPFAGD
jgi:hypothetical protein